MLDAAFIDELASSAPVPGGGGACACCGALASALASMVGNLTVGKARYADVEGEVLSSLGCLATLRERLVALVDEDARAFEPLAAAYRMPRETPDERAAKEDALQEALVGATEVPLEIMRACVEVLRECDFMARCGSRMAVSDAGASALFAKAALQGASLNVLINAGSMADAARAEAYRAQAEQLVDEGTRLADAVYAFVLDELGGAAA
ncbi:cyclodeaminase/cyclohydrolase family protein [Adlercreutzia sp. ZJ473]|uniref:cyclodeaminase/cyclohydrolase family protein n=1 Tax=Adlercreutzia sp. ZJ473 TaxID=2722822 RepID=UPI0020A636E7|nr:cyclodeaminase/cyclohydrolase family protein [Adlercreutzia sp. ZJ473]